MTRWGFSFETSNRQIFSSHLSPGTILSKPSRPKPESSTCSETSPGPRLRLPDFFTHFLGGDLKSSDAACGTSPGDDGRSVVMPRRSWSRSESVGLGWNDGKSEASTGGRAPKNHAVFQLAKKRTTKVATQAFFIFCHYLGKWSNLKSIFFGWVVQPPAREGTDSYVLLGTAASMYVFHRKTPRIGEVASSFKHCWWFRNPAITSWYLVNIPLLIYIHVFFYISGGDRRISSHQQ